MNQETSPGRSRTTRRHRSSRGQSLVEFAIVLPVLILVVGGAVDLGRVFFAYVSTENAAKEGAIYGATNPRCDVPKTGCGDPNTVRWHVINELTDVPAVSHSVQCRRGGVSVSVDSCREGDRYHVTVSHDFALLTPILTPIFGSGVELTSEASAVVLNSSFDPNSRPVPLP